MFAIVMAVTQFAQLFADFGVGAAVIQQRDTTPVVLSSCFWLNLAIGIISSLLIIVGAPFAKEFFDAPELGLLSIGAAANVVACSIMVVPQSLLTRDFKFREYTIIQMVAGIAGAVVAVGAALSGIGVWSLIIQPLIGTLVATLLIFRISKWQPRLVWSYREIRGIMSFSFNLLGSNLIGHIGRNIHNFILGKSLGTAALGQYNMAGTITYFPIGQISAVIVRVLFPALSRLQDDLPRFRAGYLGAISAIGLGTFPITSGIFSVADDLVAVILGAEWLPVAPVLKIFAWYSMVQCIGTTGGTILLSTGNSRIMLSISTWSTIGSAIALFIGSRWGLIGASVAYASVNSISYVLMTCMALRRIGLPTNEYFLALARPFAAAMVMTVIVSTASFWMREMSPVMRLSITVTIGVISYALITFLINRNMVLSLLQNFRPARPALGENLPH